MLRNKELIPTPNDLRLTDRKGSKIIRESLVLVSDELKRANAEGRAKCTLYMSIHWTYRKFIIKLLIDLGYNVVEDDKKFIVDWELK